MNEMADGLNVSEGKEATVLCLCSGFIFLSFLPLRWSRWCVISKYGSICKSHDCSVCSVPDKI